MTIISSMLKFTTPLCMTFAIGGSIVIFAIKRCSSLMLLRQLKVWILSRTWWLLHNLGSISQIESSQMLTEIVANNLAARSNRICDDNTPVVPENGIEGDLSPTSLLLAASTLGMGDMCLNMIASKADVTAKSEDGDTALTLASEKGLYHVCVELINENADINSINNFGSTALIEAARRGHTEVCNLLLLKKADISCQNMFGATALMNACAEGHSNTCLALLSTPNVNPNLTNSAGDDALMAAARNGLEDVCDQLIKCKADLNARNNGNCSALLNAIQGGNVNIAIKLIHHGVCCTGDSPQQLLVLTAAAGYLELCLKLINSRADVNALGIIPVKDELVTSSKLGRPPSVAVTPLIAAVQNNHLAICELLLSSHCSVDARAGDGSTALIHSCCNGDTIIAKLLLDANADVNLCNAAGTSPLVCGAINGFDEICALLLEYNADITIKNSFKCNPLLAASKSKSIELCIKLIQMNLNHQCNVVNEEDICGDSALRLWCKDGNFKLCQELIRAAADVNSVDSYGNSPLMIAAGAGHASICSLLISAKCNIAAVNFAQQTAFQLAANQTIREILNKDQSEQ